MGFKTNIAIQSIACNNFSLETQEQVIEDESDFVMISSNQFQYRITEY